jgi:hypothetical protein
MDQYRELREALSVFLRVSVQRGPGMCLCVLIRLLSRAVPRTEVQGERLDAKV